MVLQFRGRENAHRELGFEKMQRIANDLKTMANLDQEPKLTGRAVGMTLSPLPKEKRQRHFHLYHGELIDVEDFDDEDDDDDDSDDDSVKSEETSEDSTPTDEKLESEERTERSEA